MNTYKYNTKESDYKLFKSKLPDWQEKYMKKLNEEYIKLLSRNENPSTNFWNLHDKIINDCKKKGVIIYSNSSSNLFNNLCDLLNENVISFDDLNEFSIELVNELKNVINLKCHY